MTLQQIEEKQKSLESKVQSLILDFEKETKSKVLTLEFLNNIVAIPLSIDADLID